jgi:hypothetical protein
MPWAIRCNASPDGVELVTSLLLRESASSLKAITRISQHLESKGLDPSDIEIQWLKIIDTFGL